MAGAAESSLITAVFFVVLWSRTSWISHETRRLAVSVLMVWGRQLSAGIGWALPGS